MKYLISIGLLFLLIVGCETSKPAMRTSSNESQKALNDTVRIANDELEYEVIIIDAGFNSWFLMNAKPRNFYSQTYLEARNRDWVLGWNNKFHQGNRNFDMPIDYQGTIDYGYEVNYMLFNYLTYFQLSNNIKLGGFAPRI